jgi:hypothetical protein
LPHSRVELHIDSALEYLIKMPSTVYFTAFIAATGTKHTIAVPTNYSMQNMRGMLSKSTKIGLKELQLSRGSKLLPHRHKETVMSSGILGGHQVLVSSKKDQISEILRNESDAEGH